MTNKEKIGRLQDHIDRHSKEPHAFYINAILNQCKNILMIEDNIDSEWISVDKHTPLNSDEYLVYAKGTSTPLVTEVFSLWFDCIGKRWRLSCFSDEEIEHFEVTHWRDLPEPPKD